MLKLINLYTGAELICFISALVCLLKAQRYWQLLIPYMFITCAVEIGTIPLQALYRANPIPINSSAWIYNLLLLLQVGALTNMFYNIIKKHKPFKLTTLSVLTILLLLYCYELFTNPAGIFNYNSITYSVMSVSFVVYSLYYYYLLLNSDEYVNLIYLPEFWWVTGTLFFFFGTTGINLFYTKLVGVSVNNKLYLSYISNILIVILYGCWTYAFICKRWMILNK